MICKDPFTKLINVLGYAPLKLPSTGSLIGVVVAKGNGIFRRIGKLSDVIIDSKDVEKLEPYTGKHPDISGYMTDIFKLGIVFDILKKFLKPLQPPDIKAAFSNADKVSVNFSTVMYRAIDYLPYSQAIKGKEVNENVPEEFFVINKELLAQEIFIEAYDHRDVKLGLEVAKIKNVLGADADAELVDESTVKLIHKGEPMAFAVCAFKVNVKDGRAYPELDFLEEPVRAMARASVKRIERVAFVEAVGPQTLLEIIE